MQEIPFEELISALYDGELSPEERAAVERRLAESPDAARQLREFEQLSELLRDMPQVSLPAEFSGLVLKQAEREMLIPRLRGTAPVPRRPAWWFAAAWGASLTAAGIAILLISTQLGENASQDRAVAIREDARAPVEVAKAPVAAPDKTFSMAPASPAVKDNAMGTAASASHQSVPSPEIAAHAALPTDRAVVTEPSSLRAAEASPSAGATGRARMLGMKNNGRGASVPSASEEEGLKKPLHNVSTSPPAAMARVPASAPLPTEVANRDGSSLDANKRLMPEGGASAPAFQTTNKLRNAIGENISLADLVPGQTFDALQVAGDRMAVVRVVVVDQAAGMQALQVVLHRNSLAPAAETSSAVADAPAKNQPRSKLDVHDATLQGVLVETTNEQVVSVLRDMQQEKAVMALEIQSPAPLSALASTTDEASVPRFPNQATENQTTEAKGKDPSLQTPVAESLQENPTLIKSHLIGNPSQDRSRETKEKRENYVASQSAPQPASVKDDKAKPSASTPGPQPAVTQTIPSPSVRQEQQGQRSRFVRVPSQSLLQVPFTRRSGNMRGNEKQSIPVADIAQAGAGSISNNAVPTSSTPAGQNMVRSNTAERERKLAREQGSSRFVNVLFVLEMQENLSTEPIRRAGVPASLPKKAGGLRFSPTRFSRHG